MKPRRIERFPEGNILCASRFVLIEISPSECKMHIEARDRGAEVGPSTIAVGGRKWIVVVERREKAAAALFDVAQHRSSEFERPPKHYNVWLKPLDGSANSSSQLELNGTSRQSELESIKNVSAEEKISVCTLFNLGTIFTETARDRFFALRSAERSYEKNFQVASALATR